MNGGGSKALGSLLPSLERWASHPQRVVTTPLQDGCVADSACGGVLHKFFHALDCLRCVAAPNPPAPSHVSTASLNHLSHGLWNFLPRDAQTLLPFYVFTKPKTRHLALLFNKRLAEGRCWLATKGSYVALLHLHWFSLCGASLAES